MDYKVARIGIKLNKQAVDLTPRLEARDHREHFERNIVQAVLHGKMGSLEAIEKLNVGPATLEDWLRKAQEERRNS